MNIAMLLDMAADGFGDRIAIGSREEGLTYDALRARARTRSQPTPARPMRTRSPWSKRPRPWSRRRCSVPLGLVSRTRP